VDQREAARSETKAGEPVRDLEFWKTDALRAREERDKAKERLRALETELTEFRAREVERARADGRAREEAERERLEREGKYKEALEATTRKHTTELARLRSSAGKRLLPAAILAAARQVSNLAPDALGDLPDLVAPHVRLNEENFEVEVLGAEGKPLTDEQARPVSLEQFVSSFVQARPYLLLDGMQPGTGLAPGPRAGQGADLSVEAALRDPRLAAAWRARDPDGYRRACEEYHAPERVRERAKAKFGSA
jgi:hypothetical protein